jgi:hypothetical protein
MEENKNVLQTLTKDVMKEEIYVENEFLKKGIIKRKKGSENLRNCVCF